MAAALLCLGVSAAAHAAEPQRSDLDLYAATMLAGLHSHPVGIRGARLARAERALARRRAVLRIWLVGRVGEEAVARVEREIHDEVEGVYWTRGPTEEEEWADIERARRVLGTLEQRRRRAQRSH